MVGEIAECLLQAFERILAAGQTDRRNDTSKDLQRVPQLLRLDSKFVHLVGIAKPAIGRGKESIHERAESPRCIVAEGQTGTPRSHPLQEGIDPPRPVGLDQPLVEFSDRLT